MNRSLVRWSLLVVGLACGPVFAQVEGGDAAPPAQDDDVLVASGPAPSSAMTAGTFGLTASVFGGGSGGLGLIYFLEPNSAVHISASTQIGIVPSSFSLSLGLGYRMYLGKAGPVSMFAQPAISIGLNGGVLGYGLSAGFGLEYFLAERLSTGVMVALGASASNLFQEIQIGTSTSSLFLNIYF